MVDQYPPIVKKHPNHDLCYHTLVAWGYARGLIPISQMAGPALKAVATGHNCQDFKP